MNGPTGDGLLHYTFIRPPNRRYTFAAELLAVSQERIVLRSQASPSKPLHLHGEEVLADGYGVIWFLYKGKGYDIGRFYRPDGTWTGYYVNIHEPVQWTGDDARTLEPMVDLFLDLWITREGEYVVLDEDEFATAVEQTVLSPRQARAARAVLSEVISTVKTGVFPPPEVRDYSGAIR